MQCEYFEDLLDGNYSVWFENGKIKHQNSYSRGSKEGVYEGWYDNGEKSYEGNYRIGEKDGVWIFLMKMVQFCIENHIFKVERLEIRNSGG